ncbi:aldolase [Lachnospiraceae bacterium]|uniref:class II aldolase/adducin family protein n=1 Tax=Extibacter sp. GGCC_0201 TaxID=2731209 RepID=UPI001AA0C0D9|nr:class II aldolase/adducin family protein [Extibacter sp. GGCC_0201]MBO1721141.1 class II aldolase/adducin family protein [Extibacter sp. GGCC_0201]BDF35419.1 aldolase [Lachnospiraceae bacterium]BDF39421.1 aldolase [Lachnospiraceae bacterium]
MKERELKELICDIGKRIYTNGFVAANDGNITVKLNEKEYLTTPTGISKGYLRPEMIVKVDRKGEMLEGEYTPSSEVKVHLKIYEQREDVGAVVHAHPPYATTFAVAHIPLDFYLLPEAVYALGAVPVIPYAQPSTQELADGLIPYLQDYDAFLLENHGTVTVGTDLIKAFYKTETLEYNAKITYMARLLGRSNELSREEIDKLLAAFHKNNPGARHPGYVKFND